MPITLEHLLRLRHGRLTAKEWREVLESAIYYAELSRDMHRRRRLNSEAQMRYRARIWLAQIAARFGPESPEAQQALKWAEAETPAAHAELRDWWRVVRQRDRRDRQAEPPKPLSA